MRVYYLSSAPFALSNLALKRLKISRFADLNDPFELLAANLANAEHRAAFGRMKEDLNATQGLVCFSRTWSNPLLWGHYAEKHTGIALGFDVPAALLSEVIYTSQRVRIEVDPSTKAARLDEKLINRLLLTKFSDWRYEEELRTFVQLDQLDKEAGLYFLDFSPNLALMEVILGPRCELPVERIRALLQSDLPQVKVLKARMGFREFRVVEDRTYRKSAREQPPASPALPVEAGK